MKVIEISSLTHPIVKHLVKLRSSRQYRQLCKSALVTGQKLIREIVSEVHFKVICVVKDFSLPFTLPSHVQVYQVSPTLLKKISGLENPEPIVAEVDLPPFVDVSGKNFLLILDGVSDPGNMGTLIRSALALNWEGVFITPNCTDPFNEKAIRAAKGATFRLPLACGSLEELVPLLQAREMKVYLADVGKTPFQKVNSSPPIALILGNEAHGASNLARALSQSISIPIHPKMESLNVATAGAILMYELRGEK